MEPAIFPFGRSFRRRARLYQKPAKNNLEFLHAFALPPDLCLLLGAVDFFIADI